MIEEETKLHESKIIIKNMAQCLRCKDVICSNDTHDYHECACGRLAVDGGRSYLRRSFANRHQWRELSVIIDLYHDL